MQANPAGMPLLTFVVLTQPLVIAGVADENEACLCVFDIDRTLTGRQGSAGIDCPRDKTVEGVWDAAYSGGVFTLSELSGLSSTFCGSCYLGVCSAGGASGSGSEERAYLEEHVLVTGPQQQLAQRLPSAKAWSRSGQVDSPFVVYQQDGTKQVAVQQIVSWYGSNGIYIPPQRVHFFGDRTGNIRAFRGTGFNAREVSCGSRDLAIQNGAVGLCGATPKEIVDDRGVFTCADVAARLPAYEEVLPTPAPTLTSTPPPMPAPTPAPTPASTVTQASTAPPSTTPVPALRR